MDDVSFPKWEGDRITFLPKGETMKNILAVLSVAGITAMTTTAVTAQATTQQAVLGESSNPTYSVRVEGQNGVIYNCKPELTTTADGRPARVCIREKSDDGVMYGSGTGIGNPAPAVAAILVAVAIAAGSDSDSAGATTGTDN